MAKKRVQTDIRQTLKGREMKNEKYKKSLTTTIKFFTFIYGKKYIQLENIIWEHIDQTITFLIKIFLVQQDIQNEAMKHQRPYRYALVFQMSYFDPKYLAIRYFNVGFDSNGLFLQMAEK